MRVDGESGVILWVKQHQAGEVLHCHDHLPSCQQGMLSSQNTVCISFVGMS